MSGSSYELQNLVHNNITGGNGPRNEVGGNSTSLNTDFATFKNQVIQNNVELRFLKSNILNSFDGKILSKPILLLACEEKGEFRTVNNAMIKILLENGAKVDYVDTTWYGWEALHYTAYASNPDKLKVLCDKLGEEKVNTLTMLSENALHVLLEHGASAETFNVSCQNGTDLRMAKIISKEDNQVTECARILIDANIDINHPNFWNETPILIAIKRRYFKVVKLLLQTNNIDLDSCRDTVSGKTPRELLKGEDGLGVLPTASGLRSPKKILFSLLKSGDEDNFLKYNGGKISDFVKNLEDGDNESNSSCNLLQYCFRRGLIFWYQDKASNDYEQYRHQDITANRLVDVFCENGMAKSIQHLLENEANVDFTLRKFEENHSVLEAAIIKGYYPIVALILSKQDYEVSYEKICQAMVKLLKNHSRGIDLNNTLSVVLSRLLDQINTLRSNSEEEFKDIYQKIEPKLSNLLKNGAKIISAENQLLLLKFPSSLCWTCEDEDIRNNTSWWCCQNSAVKDAEWGTQKSIHRKICFCKSSKKSILEDIDPEVLCGHLDDCVEQEGTDIKINCDSFLKEGSVYPVFETFLSSKKVEEFLNHSVFKILIMRQWENLRLKLLHFSIPYIYLNVFFHVFFYVLLHLYVLYSFNGAPCPCLFVLGLICLGIFSVKEILQMIANCKLYCKEVNNYFELFFIISGIITYSSNKEWVDVFRVLSILSSNIVLFFLLENLPSCAKYITILRTIIFYLKYVIFYFIQFMAFAICFYILFSKKDQVWYIDLFNKIFETVILFTGNLDYMDTPWKEENNNSTSQTPFHNFPYKEPISKVVFIIFVLFLAIILQNLLLGLLVIDMGDLHKNSALAEQVKRAGFVVRLHKFFKSCCLKIILTRVFQYSEMKPNIKIIVNDSDRKALKTKEEKQNFEFILTKKVKRPNVLKKLRNYIRMKINERSCEGLRNDKNKQIVDKLGVIEEIIKNLHEIQGLKKSK